MLCRGVAGRQRSNRLCRGPPTHPDLPGHRPPFREDRGVRGEARRKGASAGTSGDTKSELIDNVERRHEPVGLGVEVLRVPDQCATQRESLLELATLNERCHGPTVGSHEILRREGSGRIESASEDAIAAEWPSTTTVGIRSR
jgi:hypothetical protein